MPGPYSASDDRNYYGFGKQSVKGSGVAPTLFVPYAGSVATDHGVAGDEVREGGSGLYVGRLRKTAHDPKGSVTFAVRPSLGGKLLAWFFGDDTLTGAGPYTHTIDVVRTNTWVSVERCIADEIIDRFVDGMIRKLTLSGDAGGDLMGTIEWDSLTAARQATPATDTYEAAVPWQQDEATYTIDGSAAADVRSWSVELEWGSDTDIRLSKVTRDQLPKLGLSGTVKVRQLIDDDSEYRATAYTSASGTAPNKDFNTSGSFVVNYNDGAAGAANRQLTLSVNKIGWKEPKLTEPNPDGEIVYLERTGVMIKTTTTVQAVAITGDSTAYDV